MVYGPDYHDLAQFYWEEGNREQALAVAEEGLKKGQGRMDELRRFLAGTCPRQVWATGERYLDLQFAQATDSLTLESYKTFKHLVILVSERSNRDSDTAGERRTGECNPDVPP